MLSSGLRMGGTCFAVLSALTAQVECWPKKIDSVYEDAARHRIERGLHSS